MDLTQVFTADHVLCCIAQGLILLKMELVLAILILACLYSTGQSDYQGMTHSLFEIFACVQHIDMLIDCSQLVVSVVTRQFLKIG